MNKLKPNLEKDYPKNHNLYLFQDDPIMENFLTYYMEETQNGLQGLVSFEQFKLIHFTMGIPYIIIDFLGYISGEKDQIERIN